MGIKEKYVQERCSVLWVIWMIDAVWLKLGINLVVSWESTMVRRRYERRTAAEVVEVYSLREYQKRLDNCGFLKYLCCPHIVIPAEY